MASRCWAELLAFVSVGLLGACSGAESTEPSGGECQVILFSSVELTVVDATTNAHLCAADVVATSSGEPLPDPFTVEATGPGSCVYVGHFSSAGPVVLTVSLGGYEPETVTDIAIQQSSGCTAQTPPLIEREIRLSPQS